jgi:hypothetical protein
VSASNEALTVAASRERDPVNQRLKSKNIARCINIELGGKEKFANDKPFGISLIRRMQLSP